VTLSGYVDRILCAQVYEVARETPLQHAPRISARLGETVLIKREAWRAVSLAGEFPARRNEFPVPDHRESVATTAERLRNFGAESARRAPVSSDFPIFSL
jgi:hypothetical protein